jgi:hypothetical protein
LAYLDSQGNVSDLTVQNWAYFHRMQTILPPTTKATPPATALPAGAEKASKGH